MKIPIYFLNSCTTESFEGNPTPVCLLPMDCNEKLLQSIATELNQPVTVFILKETEEYYKIRYFTSTTEIPACGHGTLAAPEYDFLLRSLCPWIGIDEDPVTGSVHSSLAPFWTSKFGKDPLRAYQASARGGEIQVSVSNNKSVSLKANAIVIFRGEIELHL